MTEELWSDVIGGAGTVLRYRPCGRPVLAFPDGRGRAGDFENDGMTDAAGSLIDAGLVKLHCVDRYDGSPWSDHGIPPGERPRGHSRPES